jgi:uncharacterized protein
MSAVEKVSIALSSELLRAVRGAVLSGEYATASEVVREALREWKQRRPAAALAAPVLADAAVYPLSADRQEALRALTRAFAVQQLGLFGSALRDDFDGERSDLDVAVEFAARADLDSVDQYFGFKAALETLFGRHVDLVELSSMPDSRLKRQIERTQVSLYVQAA